MCSSKPRVEAGVPEKIETKLDRETVELVGKQKIVLRCGKASITLLPSGKVVIRGTQIVSRSTGANRIRGGSIELN